MKHKNRLTKLIERLFGTRQISLTACSSALIIEVPESNRAIQRYVAEAGRNATYLTEPGKGELVGERQLRTNTSLHIAYDFRDETRAYVNTGELYPTCLYNNPKWTVVVVQNGQRYKPEDLTAKYSKRLDDFVMPDGKPYEGPLLDAQGKFGFRLGPEEQQGLADVIRKIGTEKCLGNHPILGDTAKLRGVLEEFVEKYIST